MFPEVRGECEELNNSPQIETAADGRPLTSYAANSRSNGATRRVWRLGWRTRELGDQGWRPRMESERVWRPRMEIERVWRPRTESERVWRPSMENEREWRLRGQGKSAVCRNGITELHWTLDRERKCHISAVERHTGVPQAARESAGLQQ